MPPALYPMTRGMLPGVRGEPLKGHIDTMLLAALARGETHGYALVQRLGEAGEGAFELGEGTVYPALHRLERQGLVRSGWTSAAGRRRRVYALTAAGYDALATRRGEWRTFARGMHALLEGA